MKKIMFNDRYGLTEAVLEGRKTQTRRIASLSYEVSGNEHTICGKLRKVNDTIELAAQYKVGEVVAIAQRYKDIQELLPQDPIALNTLDGRDDFVYTDYTKMIGWNNKMFVKAELMPSHIKITNIRVERLQDISDEDCLKEGITHNCGVYKYTIDKALTKTFMTAKEAYASLIDKVSGKGTWNSNPYVFVYDFELVD